MVDADARRELGQHAFERRPCNLVHVSTVDTPAQNLI
jgi:hypothetical protein